jgi:hypothetical protein
MKILLFTTAMVVGVWISSLAQIKEIPISNGRLISTDPIGNAYIATRNQLILVNRSDTVFKTFSNLRLGTLTTLDASNPLKVLLYFRDQGKIQFLDNTASELSSPINLNSFSLEQSTQACISFDNGFWVYLPSTFELIRFNQQMEISSRTKNIQQLTGTTELNPIEMKEQSNLLYLNDPDVGLLVFDIFGAFVKKIPITGIEKFRLFNHQLLYRKAGKLYNYNLLTFTETIHDFPQNKPPIDFDFSFSKIYLLYTDRLVIYSLPEQP